MQQTQTNWLFGGGIIIAVILSALALLVSNMAYREVKGGIGIAPLRSFACSSDAPCDYVCTEAGNTLQEGDIYSTDFWNAGVAWNTGCQGEGDPPLPTGWMVY